jgi:group I intron endonuclease
VSFIVYLITNKKNGKRYVGKARNARKRWQDHCARAEAGSPNAIHVAIRKYGRNEFVVEVLEHCDDEISAFNAERAHIARLGTKRRGYNMTDGGEGCSGYKHTAESLKKIGDVHRGRANTEKAKAEDRQCAARAGVLSRMESKDLSVKARAYRH